MRRSVSVSRETRTLCRALKLRTGGRTMVWVPLHHIRSELRWDEPLMRAVLDEARTKMWIATAGDPPHSASLTADGLRVSERRSRAGGLFG